MSTTILPALLSPPAALLPPTAAICSVTVVVRQRDSTGERLGGFVFLGLVLVALLVRWLFGLYLRAQQAAAAAPAPVAEAAAHVTLRAALLAFLLVASGADASPRTPEDFGRHQKLHSLQRFLADPTYFAFHGAEATPDGYYGFIATLDVYGFPELKHGQGTAGSVWVVDEGDGAQANAKAIIIGWNVLPALMTGLRLNTKCAGFQPEKGAAIAPGDVIQNVSTPKGGGTKQNLSLKIVKQGGASGDWVVHAGLNREPAPISAASPGRSSREASRRRRRPCGSAAW
ncbi:uncharacterized protein [Miscanthus floridulus]|uniref:uncharacterized protein n=1 Tax=Miscanthus floridulus TaxID=154761 RepID=UPI0034587BF7